MKNALTFIRERLDSPSFRLLFITSVFSVGLSMMRIAYTDSIQYVFLNWNLFLAAIPWVISRFFLREDKAGRSVSRLRSVSLFGVWLLFFPNAPYILTDLYHLHVGSGKLLWFDVLLILSFAWTGMLFALISLRDMEGYLSHRIGRSYTRIIIPGVLFLSAFGIYLGRFQRWNSWDILTKPHALFLDIFDLVTNPMVHPKAWGLTLLMGIFFNLIYLSVGKRGGLLGESKL